MSFQEAVKLLRRKNDLTQSELGKLVGVSDKTVSSWEREGKIPRIGVINKLVKVFGVSVSDLLELKPENYAQAQNIANIVQDKTSERARKLIQQMLDDGLDMETIENYVEIAKSLAKMKMPPSNTIK